MVNRNNDHNKVLWLFITFATLVLGVEITQGFISRDSLREYRAVAKGYKDDCLINKVTSDKLIKEFRTKIERFEKKYKQLMVDCEIKVHAIAEKMAGEIDDKVFLRLALDKAAQSALDNSDDRKMREKIKEYPVYAQQILKEKSKLVKYKKEFRIAAEEHYNRAVSIAKAYRKPSIQSKRLPWQEEYSKQMMLEVLDAAIKTGPKYKKLARKDEAFLKFHYDLDFIRITK